MKILRNILLGILMLALVALVAGYFISGISYSDGHRAGYLFKVSEKGYLLKTYEGELNLGGMNTESATVNNNIWRFSVRRSKPEVYKKLIDMQGKRVQVHYSQPMRMFFWQGESEYFVDEVTEVK